jgi:serine/threonine protein kinase
MHYLAPQRHVGPLRVEPAWDLFSLGQIFYLMLRGKVSYEFPPGETEYFSQLRAMFMSDPVPIRDRDPHIPLPVARFVDKAVHRQPEERFQNNHEFQTELKRILEES